MTLIKQLDEKLMTILAYSWRYRNLTNRNLAKKLHLRNLPIVTLIPTGFTIDLLMSGWSPLNILGMLGWLVAFYEWRAWFRCQEMES